MSVGGEVRALREHIRQVSDERMRELFERIVDDVETYHKLVREQYNKFFTTVDDFNCSPPTAQVNRIDVVPSVRNKVIYTNIAWFVPQAAGATLTVGTRHIVVPTGFNSMGCKMYADFNDERSLVAVNAGQTGAMYLELMGEVLPSPLPNALSGF